MYVQYPAEAVHVSATIQAPCLPAEKTMTVLVAICRAHLRGVKHTLPDAAVSALAASAHAFVAADLAALVVRSSAAPAIA